MGSTSITVANCKVRCDFCDTCHVPKSLSKDTVVIFLKAYPAFFRPFTSNSKGTPTNSSQVKLDLPKDQNPLLRL